jgi:peptidoglycan/xylan/chitin deacetylase (PgdA/CDA1 family)
LGAVTAASSPSSRRSRILIEVLIPLTLIAALAAAGLAAWRKLRGPAQGRWTRAGRGAAVALVAAALVGAASWQLMHARTQIVGKMVSRVDTGKRVVALTFDDGPTTRYTGEILAMLEAEGVRATFFVVGEALAQRPGACQQIVAAGHELGNHSYAHPRLVLQPYARVRDEVERTDALIRACGYEGEIHFRAPNGKQFLVLPYYLARTGRTSISWDVAPEWRDGKAADAGEIVDCILAETRPGSIILLHAMYRSRDATREALPAVLRGLKAQGYRFVTVSELLAMETAHR